MAKNRTFQLKEMAKMASLGAYHIILGPTLRITLLICSRSLGA